MPDRFDVLGIGNAIVDVLARADDGFLAKHDMVKGTMHLIDAEQAERLYDAMGPGVEISGGSAANTIAGLAGLGAKSAFIGVVRDDQLGKVFRHDIASIGVHYPTLPRDHGDPTARCLVLVTPDGQRTMNTYLGASQMLGPEDVDAETVERSSFVYLEGYLFDPPPAKEAFYKAARIAHENGGKVALTLSDPFCVERHREEFRVFVRDEVDILFANESEIMALYETETFEEAREAVRPRAPIAALTRSEHGSVVVAGEETHVVAAEPVSYVVDTTGAGDLYAAGFLYGLGRDLPLIDCARFGNLAAGEIISHMGARPETDLAHLARVKGLLS
ncbi:MAG TPA: adenosine kinase [Hyphomicrobiales bacterium]|nr:adenosine kinase [Hyphomicrobiales bacterium]